ncbi:MAG: trypsin-like peptidase domain-containing protein [Acholeplasmatales bacterium]|nr:trypsin-like peptidase domain-containing protein [Acholeplasmatales bacterium]
MRKKILLGVLAIPTILVLASCNSKIESDQSNTNDYISNQVKENSTDTNTKDKTLLYDPLYKATTASLSISDTGSVKTSVEETVEIVYDSVVSISATSTSSQSAGSGVLVAEDSELGLSYLVTCFHVIEDSSIFEVTLSDGTSYEASLVGGYSDLDLAVLSIEKTDLCYASLYANSDELKLGSSVVCIGNPLGTLPGSVSSGVVSYVNRVVQVDTYSYRTLIQTDVAINSGNSGGGLFNTSGALIGIVNAKYSQTGIEGLGFAIPSNDVVKTIEELLKNAKYDVNNKVWQEGYIEGDYEFGFTISLGYYSSGFGRRTAVYYVSSVNSLDLYTGNELQAEDIIESIKVDYADSSKTDETYIIDVNEDPNLWLYSLDLSLEDTLVFTVIRGNSQIDVSVSVDQFIYSI